MKKVYFLCLFVLVSISSYSQTIIINENFDAAISGSGVAGQIGLPFSTWSGTTGGTEDPIVSNEQSSSANNSVKIVNDNDLIIHFNDLESGRYLLSFNIFVVTGNIGYFNLLSNFDGNDSEWAMQVFFNSDGTGTVDGGGLAASGFAFLHDTWIDVKVVLDLDDDFATLYLDDNEILSWQYSKGVFGSGCAKVLDVIDFFGWNGMEGDQTTLAYIDDFSFTEYSAPESPLNLTYSLSGLDISLEWEAPVSGGFSGYSIMRNNAVISNGLMTENYQDLHVYPGNYEYGVRAHYEGLGYSHASNTVNPMVPGGVERNFVVYEIGTGTWCGYCQGAALGVDEMIANGLDVAVIEYHVDDDYTIFDGNARTEYYEMIGWPTTMVDGGVKHLGGDMFESIYDQFLPYYEGRINVQSVHNISIECTQTGLLDYQATISLEEIAPYFESGFRLHTILTESHIPEVWQMQPELNFVCRGMYPNYEGTAIDFATESSVETTINFSLEADFVKENCELVAFLQHETTKEIVQAAKVSLSTVTEINPAEISKINVYPSPASNYIFVEVDELENITMFNNIGQAVYTLNAHENKCKIDISSFEKGIYHISVKTKNSSITRRVVLI
ncbi:MAG: T9SS type A sorting domain-containing protein [Bacteroidales bacterium]|nr:T9SS type A sorting domain-containing protein [Bacteroidales bacterium]